MLAEQDPGEFCPQDKRACIFKLAAGAIKKTRFTQRRSSWGGNIKEGQHVSQVWHLETAT
jgi:hypothetical protein